MLSRLTKHTLIKTRDNGIRSISQLTN